MRYSLNGFLLIVPLLVFNVMFASRLPEAYQSAQWNAVPAVVAIPENVLRWVTMLLALLLPLSFAGTVERIGALLYVVGVVAYVASWTVLIAWPHSVWGTHAAGFLAPAYTPVVWLTGIGLIGMHPIIAHIRYLPWVYLVATAAFLTFHNIHALLVYRQVGAG